MVASLKEFVAGVNLSTIIHKLFMMDVVKSSNQSVLVGILGIYGGSRGRADRILLDVVRQIDENRRLNVTTSSETWNAFRYSLSRSNVEAVSSTLESPFSVLDKEI